MDPVCQEKHKRVDERLDTHEKRLNAHAGQLDELAVSDARNTNEMSNLCKSIDSLTKTVMWLIGLTITGYAGFFYAIIQAKVLK